MVFIGDNDPQRGFNCFCVDLSVLRNFCLLLAMER